MDKAGRTLEKVDRIMPRVETPLSRHIPPASVRGLLAEQVAGSRYVFLNLAPPARTAWTLAFAGQEKCAPDFLVDRPRYPFHVVEYVAEGRGVVRFGRGREEKLGPGSVFAYAPDTRCWMRTEPGDPMRKYFFALAGRESSRRLAEAGLESGVVRRFGAPAEILGVAEDIIREGQRHGAHAPAICLKLVELLLLKVAEGTGATAGRNERARENFLRCKALIEERAEQLQTLDEIAAAARLDAASVCRLFRRFQGTSPYQYLLRRKMSLAAEHLIDTGALVKQAAARVGFADPYHFARCFKLVHGITPSDVLRYRAARQLGSAGTGGV